MPQLRSNSPELLFRNSRFFPYPHNLIAIHLHKYTPQRLSCAEIWRHVEEYLTGIIERAPAAGGYYAIDFSTSRSGLTPSSAG